MCVLIKCSAGLTLLGTMGVGTQTFVVSDGTDVNNIIIDIQNISVYGYGTGSGHSTNGTRYFDFYTKSISGTTLTVTINQPYMRLSGDGAVCECKITPTANIYMVN